MTDLAIVNANIITMDLKRPRARSLGIKGDRIAWVSEENNPQVTAGKVLDLAGRTVVPGFIESHMHLSGYALSLDWVDLTEARSIADLQDLVRVKRAENQEGAWILGHGWDQNLFAEKRFPTRSDLDAVCPDAPVYLTRVCAHLAVANSRALALAGVTRETPDPPGGEIERDSSGEPTGILKEGAMALVKDLAMAAEAKKLREGDLLERAYRNLLAAGITSVAELGGYNFSAGEIFRLYQHLERAGRQAVRLHFFFTSQYLDHLIQLGIETGFGSEWVHIQGIKVIGDGSLGARTAALTYDYHDDPGNRGILVTPPERLREIVRRAHGANLQLAIHAIGDRAAELALKALGVALADLPRSGHRHRLEHCQILNREVVEKMARLGVVASVQPVFISTDLHWAEERVGPERLAYAYPWKTLQEAGITLIGGSDCPVESFAPLLGIQTAVTRMDREGYPKGGWLPEQKLTPMEALAMFTRDAAWALFAEDQKGTLTPGKLADLVVLSDDPTTVPPEEIRQIQVLETVIGGRLVFGGSKLAARGSNNTSH